MRVLLLLVLLAGVAGAIGYLLLGGGDGGGGAGEAERMEEGAFVPPALRGTGRVGRRPEIARGSSPQSAEGARVEPGTSQGAAFLELHVLDAETGEGIPFAEILVLEHREPCPGPRDFLTKNRPHVVDGKARIPFFDNANLDLAVIAGGYVPAILCLPQPGMPIEVRLQKGLSVEGRVRGTQGKAVQGAYVTALPGPETEVAPGRFSVEAAGTDEQGRFELEGFLPGAVVVVVNHENHMPVTTKPVEVPQAEPLEIVLEAALRLKLLITTDDGRAPQHPTLTWIRKEDPAKPHISLLRTLLEDPMVPVECLPVKVPATSEALFLEVAADGYAPWRRLDWKPPVGKADVEIDVELSSDMSMGTLRAKLVDERGETVNYARAKVRPSILQLAGDNAPGAYVIEQAEDLRITAMPAGTYRLRLESPAFAPAGADVTVTPGQETIVTIPVAPPAKLHVKFFGPEGLLVRFRVMHEGEVVHGFPEGAITRGVDEATGETILTAGRDGITLAGLAGGTHTIEVMSDEVEASPTVVHLIQGDTVEVEVTVHRK